MGEITQKEELRKILLDTVNEVSDTVTLTMGPNGKTVIITDYNGNPYITKDGVSVAKSIVYKDPIKNAIASLLKQVAERTVEMAGDGTTTSICLAQAFINEGFKLLDKGVSYNELKDSLELLEKEVIKHLKDNSMELVKENIVDVATVSANNDAEIGELIQKAYNHSNVVKVEESMNTEDTLETIKGMKTRGSYFNKAFINNRKKQAIEYKDVKFIIVEGHLDSLKEVAPYLNKDFNYIIMADHFTESVVKILADNYNRSALIIGLVKTPGFGGHRKDLVEDIKFYSNAEKSTGCYIGKLDSIYADKDSLILTNHIDTTEYLKPLKELYKEDPSDLLKQRIDYLEGNISIIRVGGNSEVEMKERKDRIDDAVLATACALEEGVVEGGGVVLAKTYRYNNYTRTPILELSECLISPYIKIFGEKLDPNLKDMFKEKIFDPTKVTRVALQNAISVAKTILNTEAIVIHP